MKKKVYSICWTIIAVVMCLTFVSQAWTDYEGEVLADNPLVFLRFHDADMSDGAVVTDLGSAGVTTTYRVSGTSTFDVVPGPNPLDFCTLNAVFFNQTGDGNVHMEIHDPTEALSHPQLTVEAWVKVQPEDHSYYMRLFTSGGDWLAQGSPGASLKQPMEWAMMGGDNITYGYEAPTEDGEWHHVVGLYDSSGSGTAKTLYVDGVLIGTQNGPNDLHYDQYDYWMIGCEGNTGWQGDLFHGALDEFAIYEGLLDETRIETHYVCTPEPASLALLGLGGLALIRKRRV